MDTVMSFNNLSDKEKDDLIREVFSNKYSDVGDNLPLLKDAIEIISRVDTVMSISELLPMMNAVLNGSRFFSFVASGSSIFSIFMFPVATMISIINAYQIGHKMYAFRAIAYTLTAWAFDKPIPISSPRIIHNLREGSVLATKKAAAEFKNVWLKTTQMALLKINSELKVKDTPKEVLQVLLRTVSKNDEKILCDLIMRGFEKKLSTVANITWKSNYKIKFPS